MNKNKKIIIFSLLFICFVLIIWIIFKNLDFSSSGPSDSKGLANQEEVFEEHSFENKEKLISQTLSKKFGVKQEDVSASIALESKTHVAGFYFVNSLNNSSKGKFFGIINKNVEIVWFGAENINCKVLLENNFPQEMIPSCF